MADAAQQLLEAMEAFDDVADSITAHQASIFVAHAADRWVGRLLRALPYLIM